MEGDRIRGRVSARFADSPYDQPYEHEGGGGSGGGGDSNEGYDLFEPVVDQHAHEAASSNLSQAGDGYNGYVDMEDDNANSGASGDSDGDRLRWCGRHATQRISGAVDHSLSIRRRHHSLLAKQRRLVHCWN